MYPIGVRAWAGEDLVVQVPLAHGQDPAVLLQRAGWRVERPLRAGRGTGGEVVLEYAVRSAAPCSPPPRLLGGEPVTWRSSEPVPQDDSLVLAEGEVPVPRQRVSAAVLVVADVPVELVGPADGGRRGGRSVLATRYSGSVLRWDGSWGLPGGGLETGEDPAEAARREAFEETGQEVSVDELAFVQSARWVGRSPRGGAEDFHAVRLVYRGRCPAPTAAVVHDVGGTTSAAAWVPLGEVAQLQWAPGPLEQLRVLGVLS